MSKNHTIVDVLTNINSQSCPRSINLHCHTTSSDGSMDPIELIKQASTLGLKHLAITDHHSIEGYLKIKRYLDKSHFSISPTNLWTGIEISCLLKGCLVHVIGLGFDLYSQPIKPYLHGEAVTGSPLRAENVVNAINKSRGISILAHPARYRINFPALIHEAHLIGINGLEVWYDYDLSPKWSPSDLVCKSISQLAKKYKMLSSCGTDTHGYSLLGR